MIVQDLEVGLKIAYTLSCSMLEKVLMVMGEVDICFRPSLIPPIIQEILVDHQVFTVIVMAELEIGLRPSNFLHIIIVN